jgi:predicted 3-demethylubiquinone-9 3-methyltransferase (glyoxalase superfamily)
MTDNNEKLERHPAQVLSDDLVKFTQDIDCLFTTFPLLMEIMRVLHNESRKNLHNFIDEHATDKTENSDNTSFTLKLEDTAEYDRLKNQLDHANTAIRLIPRHFVTSLVSQYDSFLGCVIRFIFAVKPQILNASEKVIPFTELIKFSTIEAAREYIIEKEVETVIRKSHVDQFAWLKDKLGTPFNKNLKSWPDFIELTECRNLFVHCDGRVSSQYLSVCTEHKCDINSELSIGDQLAVNLAYFQNAYKCVYEIGVKLAHVIWRKLCPEHLDGADSNLIEITYGLISKGDFDIAIRLLDFFTQDQMKHGSDVNKRIMIINRAQAYKWAKDNDTCLKLLSYFDCSATGDSFKLAVAVLKEEYVEAFILMKRLMHDESFHKTAYKDWPLFKELRKEEEFALIYEQCYGEPFILQQKTEDEIEFPAEEENEIVENKINGASLEKKDGATLGEI